MEEAGHREVRLQFVREPHYQVFYASGVYGGLTPYGELWIDFFIDRATPSDYEVIEIDESGTEIARRPQRLGAEFTRYLQCAVIIHPERIPSIIEWLQQKYSSYCQRVQQSQKPEQQGGTENGSDS